MGSGGRLSELERGAWVGFLRAHHTLVAELQGFSKVSRSGVVIRAGLNLSIDLTLQVGRIERHFARPRRLEAGVDLRRALVAREAHVARAGAGRDGKRGRDTW